MQEDTIVQLMKTEAQKLIGNLASFQKFSDKFEFRAKVSINLGTLKELFEELKLVKVRHCHGCNVILRENEHFKDAEKNEYCEDCKTKIEIIAEDSEEE